MNELLLPGCPLEDAIRDCGYAALMAQTVPTEGSLPDHEIMAIIESTFIEHVAVRKYDEDGLLITGCKLYCETGQESVDIDIENGNIAFDTCAVCPAMTGHQRSTPVE